MVKVIGQPVYPEEIREMKRLNWIIINNQGKLIHQKRNPDFLLLKNRSITLVIIKMIPPARRKE